MERVMFLSRVKVSFRTVSHRNARTASGSCRIALAVALCLLAAGRASADVFGRLHFSVKNAADEKPIEKVKITLHDSANVRPDVMLTTDAQGSVTTGQIDARPWQAATEADLFQPDTRSVTVVADTTTEVEVLLEPLKEKVIRIITGRNLVTKSQTNNVTQRDQNFITKFPVTAGNPQSLPNVLRSTPGMAADSVN